MGALITAGVTIALTVYAMTCKKDFTIMGASIFLLCGIFLILGIVNIFIRSDLIENAILFGSAILYSIYLIYDTQLIVGNKKNDISMDDYIFAAMMIYIDIIQLFIKIV